jgi:FkbM family methyltransferase
VKVKTIKEETDLDIETDPDSTTTDVSIDYDKKTNTIGKQITVSSTFDKKSTQPVIHETKIIEEPVIHETKIIEEPVIHDTKIIEEPVIHDTKTEFFGELQDGKYVDQVLREYFPDYSYKGVFFDVGAFEPIRISNSHHFQLTGWEVYCFEANPDKMPFLRNYRNHVFNYAITDTDSTEPLPFETIKHRSGWTASYSAIKVSERNKEIFGWNGEVHTTEIQFVKQRTLDTIIREEIPQLRNIDIMSVDIGGWELSGIRGLDLERFPPKVIVVENGDPENKSIYDHLEKFGYRMDKRTAYNDYYLHKNYPTSIYTVGH